MRHHRVGIVAVAMAALLGVGAATPLAAASSGKESSDPPSYDGAFVNRDVTSSEELYDIQFYAEQQGMTFDEAYAALAWQPPFVEYVEELRHKYLTAFAGASIDGARDVSISFAGGAPESVISEARLAGLRVNVVEDLGMSEKQLVDQKNRIHADMIRAGYPEASTHADFVTGEVFVDVMFDNSEYRPTSDPRSLPETAQAANVSILRTNRIELVNDATLYGGARMEYTGQSGLNCTTAFKVRRNGVNGFLSAGHCGNNVTIENFSGGTEYSTTFQKEYQIWAGDFQWHSTGQTESDDFYHNWGQLRDTGSVGSIPVVGQSINRFGQKTGRYTYTVYALHVSKGVFDELVAVNVDRANSGDSGGPYFWSTKAWGIHQGSAWVGLGSRDVFSRLDYAQSFLGVTVQTS